MSTFSKDELKRKRVGVLLGGLSSEREVSLRTGAAVSKALRGLGYEVVEIDVGKDLPARLVAEKVDVAFIALHGRYGEDGCVQGLLECMFIPYTGSGVMASSLGMDKVFAKQVFVAHGIPTPPYRAFTTAAEARVAADSLPFGFPVVVKPSREGSSVGVHICKTREEYLAAVEDASKLAGSILVEQYIKGREVQGGVLDDEALGVIEVVAAREFYDYQAKYQSGGTTQYLFPAPLPPDQYERVNQVCLAAHRALGCSGGSRSDVILTPSGEVFLLEINTLPGMTEASLLPKIAAGRGIDFPGLCERLLQGASLKA
jgi:D-alanine-D-alanine ligase